MKILHKSKNLFARRGIHGRDEGSVLKAEEDLFPLGTLPLLLLPLFVPPNVQMLGQNLLQPFLANGPETVENGPSGDMLDLLELSGE